MEETFGSRLDALMNEHQLYRGRGGQSALSRDTGVPQPTINRLLSNKSTPEMATAKKLAAAFGVSVEWLITGEGGKKPSAREWARRSVEEFEAELAELEKAHPELAQRPAARLRLAARSEAPAFVIEAMLAVWDAHLSGAPKEAFESVTTLMRPLNKPRNAGTISSKQKDEASGETPAKVRPVSDVAARAVKQAKRSLATRGEEKRGAGVEENRKKGSRH